jgi:protein tyrosine phosphatase (PTP) superfamily phosphohydrolase (DUF442 family)
MNEGRAWWRRSRILPWLVLAAATLPSVWWIRTYDVEPDPELPAIVRPTFSKYPPAAYRLADAGDTIDHIAVYVASAGLVLAGWGWLRNLRNPLWAAAFALAAAGFWHAATPAPLVDGWHGLGWRVIFDADASIAYRLSLAACAVVVVGIVAWAAATRSLRSLWIAGRALGILGLLAFALVLMVLRQVRWVDQEPFGFWPRWIYVWGLLAWALMLLKAAPAGPAGWKWKRGAILLAMLVIWLGLDFTGRGLFWYQRPIHRLREVVPGRLYISAMPTYQGLDLAQARHHFRTIINLFPEYTSEQSPHWADELRFAQEHGLNYVGNDSRDGSGGEDYVTETIKQVQDPSSWPVLVHCHASMDRSPAWMGIYRFVVQGWPLADAIREIEWHRGLRPRASVTLLYLSVLPKLAPERCAHDPTIALLRECASGRVAPQAKVAVRSDGESARNGRRSPPATASVR